MFLMRCLETARLGRPSESRRRLAAAMRRGVLWCMLAAVPGLPAAAAPGWLAERASSEPIPVAVFGPDDRERVPAGLDKTRRGLGLLFNNSTRTVCSAFCVAPQLVATARHCLFRATEGRTPKLEDYWLTLDAPGRKAYARISGFSAGAAAQNVMVETAALHLDPPIDVTGDWAVVRLTQQICRDAVLPTKALSADEIFEQSQQGNIMVLAYHRDFREWEPALSPRCEVRGEFEGLTREAVAADFVGVGNLLLHRCDTGEASSGSPLLLDAAGGPYVVGINVGTYVQSKIELKDGKAERGSPATLANTAVNIAHVGGRIEAFANATVAVTRDDIREFQVRLRALGRFAGPVDGLFGEDLRSALLRYQRDHGLLETGLPTADLAQRLAGFPPAPERRPAGRATDG